MAKEKIEKCEIAQKSPDLRAWGYAVWKDVSQMMRKQEQSSLVNKRETRNEYLKRLKKAVTSLPKTFTDMTIDDMSGRCRRLCKARGGHFE